MREEHPWGTPGSSVPPEPQATRVSALLTDDPGRGGEGRAPPEAAAPHSFGKCHLFRPFSGKHF